MYCKRPANIIVYAITLHHIHNSICSFMNRSIFRLLFDTRWSSITTDPGRTTLSIDLTVVIVHVDHSCSTLRWIESIHHGLILFSTNERPLKRADGVCVCDFGRHDRLHSMSRTKRRGDRRVTG